MTNSDSGSSPKRVNSMLVPAKPQSPPSSSISPVVIVLSALVVALSAAVIGLGVRVSQLSSQSTSTITNSSPTTTITPIATTSTPVASTTGNTSNRSIARTLWPLPAQYNFGVITVPVDPASLKFSFASTSLAKSQRLQRAFDRFAADVLAQGCPGTVTGVSSQLFSAQVSIDFGDDEVEGVLTQDESYNLNVTADNPGVFIAAKTVVGALRALETLKQLIQPITPLGAGMKVQHGCDLLSQTISSFQPGFHIKNAPWTIVDAPTYAHRGLLLDTSRNFFSVNNILRTIDGLAAVKMNVLHWHIVDSQSFPLESKKFPTLTQAAYFPLQVYTQANISYILAYAADRGVRIIPEFDMPGHTTSWGLYNPGLTVCGNKQPWQTYCNEPPCGQLDISTPNTTTFVNSFLDEMTTLFTDSYLHLGTDEINVRCYQDDSDFQSRLGGRSLDTALQTFFDSVIDSLKPRNKTIVFWEDAVLNHPLKFSPDNTVIQAWQGTSSKAKILAQGYKVIDSTSSYYYLDCGAGAWLVQGTGSWCDPYKSWQTMYMYNPAENDAQVGKVLGSEVAMWAEQTDDTNLDFKLWPRVAAAAEGLWIAPANKDLKDAVMRLNLFRNRLVNLGYAAGPLQYSWCFSSPDGTNQCI